MLKSLSVKLQSSKKHAVVYYGSTGLSSSVLCYNYKWQLLTAAAAVQKSHSIPSNILEIEEEYFLEVEKNIMVWERTRCVEWCRFSMLRITARV